MSKAYTIKMWKQLDSEVQHSKNRWEFDRLLTDDIILSMDNLITISMYSMLGFPICIYYIIICLFHSS